MTVNTFQQHAWWGLQERIGIRHCRATFDNYVVSVPAQATLVETLKGYVENMEERVKGGGGIVLLGPKGGGKDHLIYCVASAAHAKGLSIVWANGEELFEASRDAMDDKGSEFELTQRYTQPDIFWLSDPLPPKGELTEWQMRFMYKIIDARYRHERPCWITCNVCDLKEFETRLGAAAADRLYHGSIRFLCKWESSRKTA